MRSPARITTLALLVAAAFVLSSMERVLPNPAPMVRLGLGNIMTLVAFVTIGIRGGVWVTAGRVALVSLVWGGLLSPTAVLSAAGGAASTAGSLAHVVAQLAVASFIYVRSPDLFRLLPFLGVAALATGLFNAFIAGKLAGRLERAMVQQGRFR